MLIASVTPLALNTFTSRGCFKYSRETLVDYVTLFIVRRFHSHTDAEQHCPRPDRHPLSTAGLDHWEPGAFPHSWSERGRPYFSNWWCLLLGLVLLRLLHFFYIGNSPCSTCWTQHQAFFRSHPLNISSHLRPALKYYFRCFTGSKAPHFPRRCVFFNLFFLSTNVLLLLCRARCFSTLHVVFLLWLEALCRSCNRSQSSLASSTEIDSMRHTFPPFILQLFG